jgi:hypothetical protein
VPSYEAVDVLRSAKNRKMLGDDEYSTLKKQVFEDGREARDVKKDLSALIRQREEIDPQEAWEKKKNTQVKRLIGVLKTLRGEIETEKLLPMTLLKEVSQLIVKLQEEIE